MSARSVVRWLVLAGILVWGSASCGSDDGNGPNGDGSDLADLVASVLTGELGGLSGALVLPSGPPGCVSISSIIDTDGDGVPDNSDFSFSSSGCSFTFEGGSGTSSGTITVTDPGASFGFDASLADVSATLNTSNPTRTTVRTLNGTRTVRGSGSGTTLQQNIEITYTSTGSLPALVVETWGASYTPAAGSSVVLGIGARLPPGSANVTGSVEWNQNGTTLELELVTERPIEWAAGCESPFPSAGEVHANVLSGGPSGYLRIRYTGCGEEVETDFMAG